MSERMGAVVFDCDSTLTALEGIEVLGAQHRAEIERLTDAAMRGDLPLELVYGHRLELAQPARAALEDLGRAYIHALVPDAREVVAALLDEDIVVRILSGGLLPAVVAVAEALGLAPGAVAAVDIRFDEQDRYAGFDNTSPLARSGGKRDVLQRWRTVLPAPLMLVGDGATDLEARDAVDVFVAYAGVVERPRVVAGADAVVRCSSLAPIFPLALAGTLPRQAAARSHFEKGLAQLDEAGRSRLEKRTA
jgi:phosphoserine phosphatase